MASIIEDLLNEYRGKSIQEIKDDAIVQIAIAGMRAGQLYGELAQETFLGMLVLYVKTAVDADGVFADEEKELLNFISKPLARVLPSDKFVEMCSRKVSATKYEKLAQAAELDTILGDALARLMMCFMAIDGEICILEEQAFKELFKEFAEKLESYEHLGGSELYMALVRE